MTLLKDKVAIVTGAGRGIGRAIALKFAEAGATVICVSRSQENSEKVAGEVRNLGAKAEAVAVDVSNSDAVQAAADKILEAHPRLDILVNNAGVTRDMLLMKMSEQDWDTVLDTNLKGAFNWTKSICRPMLRQRSGRIINVASVIGLVGNAGQANYAASKAGLIGFSKAIAREFASRSVNVNVIAPGFIETDMTSVLGDEIKQGALKTIPLGRWGQAQDVANVALFLAGEQSSYITGQVIAVDGGMVMS